MQEEASKNMPFQQGLLWQLMTGGDPAQLSRFIWGDQWATADNAPPTVEVAGQQDDSGQSYAEWRDNVYEEIYSPIRAAGREIEKAAQTTIDNLIHPVNDIFGIDLGKEDLPVWLGGDVQGSLLEPWETVINYANKLGGVDLGKEDLPGWLGGDDDRPIHQQILDPFNLGDKWGLGRPATEEDYYEHFWDKYATELQTITDDNYNIIDVQCRKID